MNEAGEGKDGTDNTFNTSKSLVRREVALGVDATTAADFIRVLNSKDGVLGMIARVVTIHRPDTPYDVGTLENITRVQVLAAGEMPPAGNEAIVRDGKRALDRATRNEEVGEVFEAG
ncbi:hypothetical protein CYMTET_43576 [Cymbomonas tetramitiformis]|uniref:Uncharacterized protein n=1 Tax=Cymbomonas tetramitiformis TaxID=36881 RepID=A0AAE0C3J5_9CHLO|nr:hypothetical protein CYMTET_43576 [Cymbomonas tetramitiformis]